jgi:protein deglycase
VADGTEEMEAVIVVDVLRRAGAAVSVASVEAGGRLEVTCSRGVVLRADAALDAALSSTTTNPPFFDLIVVPGGMPGAERLAASAALTAALKAQRAAGRPVAAICAAPAVVLEAQGLLPEGGPATAHPAFSGQLANQQSVSERVAVAVDAGGGGVVVTSRGPGTAFEFALALVGLLFGEAKAREVAGPMVMAGSGSGGWEEAVRKVGV